MAYSESHLLLAFGGPLRTNESWTQTLRLSDPFIGEDKVALQAMCDSIATSIGNNWATGIAGSNATLAYVKLNQVGVDGRYRRAYTVRKDLVTPVSPGTASTHPNQVSLVVTLETGATRGYAARGRMFFPIPSASISSTDGIMSASAQSIAVSQAKTFLDGIEGAAGAARLFVYSNVGAGTKRKVTGISVGRVLDTMRSRRTSLKEARSIATLAVLP